MVRDLFFSKDENIVFYIAGYTDNSSNVKEIISMLKNNAEYLTKLTGVKQINTYFINKSSRYKYMRVFYCKTATIPVDAFVIGNENKPNDPNNWTMGKWIEY